MQSRTLSTPVTGAVLLVAVGIAVTFLSREGPPPASAGGFFVTTANDAVDANVGDLLCDADLVAEGLQCTLRAAVQESNANNGPDSIQVPAGTYTLTIPGSEDLGVAGDLDLTDDLSIHGASGAAGSTSGSAGVVIQAGEAPESGIDRILEIDSGVSVTLTDLTLRHGNVPDERGGGILNRGTLSLNEVSVAANNALDGGGIFNEGGSVDISDSTLGDNSAATDGGAIYNESGPTSLDSVDVTGNRAGSNGAGINSEGNGASLLVQDSTISGNIVESGFNGGGIDAEGANGSLNLVSSIITDNATGSNGGGIYVFSGTELTVFGSTISGNEAGGNGGGVFYGGTGPVSLTDSTIDNNTAASFGGGIYSWKAATLVNLTVSGNAAGNNGGGILVRSVTTITNSTISDNTADANDDGTGDGGGLQIIAEEGTAVVGKSIIAGNSDPTSDPDCFGTISSQGFNLVQTVSSGCQIVGTATGNITGEDPLLGPLADNGGPTLTHALLPDSPAIDTVTAGCPPPSGDQRGIARPQGPACDIGAYERQSGQPVIWGDHNCSGSPDPIDGLFNLRHDAGLPTDTGDCPDMGAGVTVDGAGSYPWGDLDCSSAANPVDGLKILRFDAGLSVDRPDECPDPGETVTIN